MRNVINWPSQKGLGLDRGDMKAAKQPQGLPPAFHSLSQLHLCYIGWGFSGIMQKKMKATI